MSLCRRQVQNPARPARSLGGLTRVVRRGMWLVFRTVHSYGLHLTPLCVCLSQELKMQALMLRTTSISQQSCYIWHGILLRTQSPVLLQTACICTMLKEQPGRQKFHALKTHVMVVLARAALLL